MVNNIGGFLNGNARQMIETLGGQQRLEDAFVAAELSFVGLFVSVFAVAAMLRLRGEEAAGRAEPLLAAPVTRLRWAASQLVVALGGAVLLLAVTGLGLGLSLSGATGEQAWWGKAIAGAAAQLPAVTVMVGLTLLAIGYAPVLATTLSWGALVLFFLLGELGPLFDLPGWVMDLSPFGHTPRLPGVAVSAVDLTGLVVVAVVLVVGGLAAVRQRDVPA